MASRKKIAFSPRFTIPPATIRPHYDGNGRTARLLTTLVLHLRGYGLKGLYALEEYYAQSLPD